MKNCYMENENKMNICILITSISNFGLKGFYNSQEIGLAKALVKRNCQVTVYKLIPSIENEKEEKIDGMKDMKMFFVPAKQIGINGIVDTSILDDRVQMVIHFADTQYAVPKVYRWCIRNHIQYIPYIGVTESHSDNIIKRTFTNIMYKRNIKVFRKCVCCVKTPSVQGILKKSGVNSVVMTPVGLDLDYLNNEYENVEIETLKKRYGYQVNDKVLLFIGRMTLEKQPLRMIDIFFEIYKMDKSYKLLMIGTGELKESVKNKIKELGIENRVKMLDQVANCDIWELYCLSDVFVNLNQQEIFGMAILEAMYYGCRVVAWNAPGPDFIIENNVNGYLANQNEKIIQLILNGRETKKASHERIISAFTWDTMAERILEMVGNING